MGFIKNAKTNLVLDAARKARESGRQVFAAVLNSPGLRPDMSGGIDQWADMIDTVEAEGWRLEQWTVAQDPKGRPQAYPLFRRR